MTKCAKLANYDIKVHLEPILKTANVSQANTTISDHGCKEQFNVFTFFRKKRIFNVWSLLCQRFFMFRATKIYVI